MNEASRNPRAWRIGALCLTAWTAMTSAANPVYVGASYGLYRSTDAGATWNMVNIPLNNPLLRGPVTVASIAIDPRDAAKIYLLGTATARAFFATADAGQTWAATPFVGMYGRDVRVDLAGKVLYLSATTTVSSGDNLLYKSTNGGATWSRLTIPNTATTPANRFPSGSPVFQFVPDAAVSGTVYVVTTGADFFKSSDFGQTWTFVAKQITLTNGSVAPGTTILGIYQDPRSPQTWYHAADHSSFPQSCPVTNGGMCGLFKSINGGATFAGVSLPSGYVSSVSVGAVAGTLYATAEVGGLGGAVMKSTDGGDTWSPIQNGLFTPRSGRVWADAGDPSTVYVNDSLFGRSFYVSTDAGANFALRAIPAGPPGCVPGNCSQQIVYSLAIAPSSQPVITSVVNAASLQPGVAANTWVTIFGSNLAPATANWDRFIVNGGLPTEVDRVSVAMGGKPAYVYFVSPGQINVLAPDLPPGPVSVTVTTPAGSSATFPVTAGQVSPAFFTWPDNQVVATRQDFSFAVKAGTFPGAATTAARPGEILILWATGFGPTNPGAPPGVATPGDRTYATSTLPAVTMNGVPVSVFGAALAPGAAGLYQIAIQVPDSIPNGGWPLRAMIDGVSSPDVLLSVRR